MRKWNHIPLFWRFQLSGWIAFCIVSFPLKWIVLEDIPGSLLVSLYRDGLSFVLTVGMREIYRRFYRRNLKIGWLALLVTAVSLAGGAILTLFSLAFHDALDFEEAKIFNGQVVFAIFYFRTGLCAGWSLLYFGIKLIRESAQHDLRLSKAESERQRAELQMLRSQMNPHFLFNALTTIRAGMGRSETQLKEAVQGLADYLRYSLENRDHDKVTLGAEVDAIEGYLAVEKARFRADLEVELDIDPEARAAFVPGVILQPLVENAIRYGRKTSPPPLKVRVTVSRPSGQRVCVEVANSGHWINAGNKRGPGGVGLENLRRRLALLYPADHMLETVSEDGWVKVRLNMPLFWTATQQKRSPHPPEQNQTPTHSR